MAEKMKQVRDLLDELASVSAMIGHATSGAERNNRKAARDKIKAEILAHLTQPAQAVDVGAIREVIAYLKIGHRFDMDMADKLTRAIGNAQAEGWRPIATAPKDGTRVLLASRGGAAWVGHWRPDTEQPYNRAGWTRFNCNDVGWEPSVWMPLSTPPQPEE